MYYHTQDDRGKTNTMLGSTMPIVENHQLIKVQTSFCVDLLSSRLIQS
jgi:hypothetical protein